MKQAQIWVSAVLYIMISIVALSLIIASGVPLMQKMKDRNTILQTKELLYTFDDTIRTVASEGPGSQRELTPFKVNQGSLYIIEDDETINWTITTAAMVAEPGVAIQEGALMLMQQDTPIKNKYDVSLGVTYDIVDLQLNTQFNNPFKGSYSVLIKHTGTYTTTANGDVPVIEIFIT